MDATDRFFTELRAYPLLPPARTLAAFRKLEALRRRRRRAMLVTPGCEVVLRQHLGASAVAVVPRLEKSPGHRELVRVLRCRVADFERLGVPARQEQTLAEDLACRNGYASAALAAQLTSRIERLTQRIVTGNMRLVVSVARRYRGQSMELLDIFQEGTVGLLTAVDRFEVKRGWAFSTYATWWIRQNIGRALDLKDRTIRHPTHQIQLVKLATAQGATTAGPEERRAIAKRLGVGPRTLDVAMRWLEQPVSLDAPTVPGGELSLGSVIADPAAAFDRQLEKLHLVELISRLSERDELVLRRRFGIGGEEKTLEEIGHELGVTRERARQLEAAALRQLRLVMDGKPLRAPHAQAKKRTQPNGTIEERLRRLNALAHRSRERGRRTDPRIRDLAIELLKEGVPIAKVQHITRVADAAMVRWCQAAGCSSAARPEALRLRRLSMLARRARKRRDTAPELHALAAELLRDGITVEAVARAAGVPRRTALAWRETADGSGEEGRELVGVDRPPVGGLEGFENLEHDLPAKRPPQGRAIEDSEQRARP